MPLSPAYIAIYILVLIIIITIILFPVIIQVVTTKNERNAEQEEISNSAANHPDPSVFPRITSAPSSFSAIATSPITSTSPLGPSSTSFPSKSPILTPSPTPLSETLSPSSTQDKLLSLPRGFVEEDIVRVSAITGAFAPNPRKEGKPMLLLSAKEGKIVVLEDPDNSNFYFEIADFTKQICTNGERGVQTIRPHPNFGENLYIFIYYTESQEGCLEDPDNGPRNRLSRFEMDKDTLQINLISEKILLQTSPLAKRVHNGGSIQFGKDGKIWLSTGEASGTSSNLDWSQSKSVLHGKILRINEDGSIPDDNPFVGDDKATECNKTGGQTSKDKVCSEIWASGLRNPFRMVMDPNTKDGRVKFYVGDVGGAVWEEISVGGTDYPGVNYGWQDKEGPCKRNKNDDCPVNEQYMDPFYYYEHTKTEQGGAVVGATFVPDVWPSTYKYMFIDFVFKEIYNLVEDEDRECRLCEPPIPGYRNQTFYQNKEDQNMIDMFFGPYMETQALYIVSRGDGITLKRIRYTGDRESNRSPEARVRIRDTDDTIFNLGQTIGFDGEDSFDPDGDFFHYIWDFGDGTITEGNARTDHVYTQKGEYRVTLTITDEGGLKDSDSIIVKRGTPPTVSITKPKEGEVFRVGQILRLVGSGVDSAGDDAQLFWEVRQHHAEHWHPFLDPGTEGNDFDLFPAPEPEDLLAATNSYLEIRLTAIDKDGLSTITSRKVMPKLVMIEVHSDPEGMEIMLDESGVITPATVTSWDNHNLLLDVEDQFPYTFDSWQDGSSRRHQSRVSLNNQFFFANLKRSTIEEDSDSRKFEDSVYYYYS